MALHVPGAEYSRPSISGRLVKQESAVSRTVPKSPKRISAAKPTLITVNLLSAFLPSKKGRPAYREPLLQV